MRRIIPWNKTRHQRLVSELDALQDCPQDFDNKYLELQLVSWLKTCGEHDACSALTIGLTLENRRGLFASRNIKAGECILRISQKTMMTRDRLPMEFQQLLPSDVNELGQLALLLLLEKRAGKASAWAPYIFCLPKWGTIHSTAFWRKEELAMISESSLCYETINRRAIMREECTQMQQIFEKYQHVFGGCVSYASFKHAYVTVCSRAWRIAGLDKQALVPFADFLNHDWSSKAVLTYDSVKRCAELFADRNYAVGEQIVINYGPLSNASLALDFGFTLPYNPYDKVELWLSISRRDKLRQEKLEYLHSCGIYTLKTMDGSDTGGLSFILREVRSVTGEAEELPQSLFTMARVMCTSTVELRCERKQDKIKEVEALTFILSRVEDLIKKRIEAILALKMQYKQQPKGHTTSLCMEMAETVLGGELRVLRSVSAWLKHQCLTMS